MWKGGGDSSVVRALDLWLKGCRFKSLQEPRENIFFSRVDFLCWLLFRYPFHPLVARKRSRSFCQKCRWQVTTKHAYILRIHVALHEVTWCMVVWCTQNLHRDGCSFMWHQPCQRCKYTTSVDIQKTHYKKLVTHVEPHASAVNLLKRADRGE